jgi:hypothetical protein
MLGQLSDCGGAVKVIADTSDRCIEDQQVIDKILSHLKKKQGQGQALSKAT